MSGRRTRSALPPAQLTIVWQSVSLLLDYPDEELLARAELIRSASRGLPPGIGDAIRSFLDHLESTPLPELQADYVETFDSRRRCNLFLTYFAHGDTRKRGMALLRFKQTYLRAGFELDDGELPDHLCVVLEFAATVDHDLGRDLMLDHRAGLELLRLSLRDLGSPWASLVDAVTATLPPLRGDERDAVRRLAAEGPPEEEVGLAPFAQPAVQSGRGHRHDPAAHAVVPRSSRMNEFLFVVVPYVCLTTFVVGHLWRYRYDKFGWTTRSSQLYENRLLRIGSPLFHFGMLGVVGGHIIGLLVPQSWTDAVGISEHTYHVVAVAGGLLAGVMTVVGMAILIYRRRTVGPVFSATTRMDKVMYAFLAVVIVLGMWNTIAGSIMTIGGEYNYREGVSVWYRSFLAFQPDPSLMADAPLGFQLHALVAFGLFALWPFTRLVHVFSAPLGYLTRPYIVYRSRDDAQLGSHRPRRGWDRVG